MRLRPDQRPLVTPGAHDHDQEESRSDRDLVCAQCGALICRHRDRLTIEGRHCWDKVNPAGIHFRILCFAAAPGCIPVGEPVTEFSWFRGYAWSVAICAACSIHLGWLFSSETATEGFFGLIEDALRESAGGRPEPESLFP